MSVIELSKQNFHKEVMESEKPVLIDFWASWCGPCKRLSPVVDQIAEEADHVKVCKVNIDDEMELAEQFHVMSIPTLVVVKDGEIARSSVGVQPKNQIMEMIKK